MVGVGNIHDEPGASWSDRKRGNAPPKKSRGGGTYPRDTETNLKEFSIVKAETS